MFKFFKNNASEEKKEAQTENQTALIARWDGFLQKVETRFQETMTSSTQMLSQQLIDTDYDYYTVFRTWKAIKPKVFTLFDTIDTTWKSKVKPLMKAEGDFWYEEEKKRSHFRDYLHNQLQREELILEGKLSLQFYDHAIQIADKHFNCTQCGASLSVKKDLFRAQYIGCKACNTTNTFEPETKFLQIGWNVVDNIAALNALDAYDEKEKALNAILSKHPPVENTLWETYKTAYHNYQKCYLKERIKLRLDLEISYQEDLDKAMQQYNEYEKTHKKII